MAKKARTGQRVQLHLVILGSAADPGVANPDRIAVRGGAIHREIVSESFPEH